MDIMYDHFLPIIVPLAALLADAVAQVAAFRYLTKGSLGKSLLLGFVTGFLVFVLLEYCMYARLGGGSEFWFLAVTNTIIYVCVSYCYFGIIGLALSLRIRILDIVDRDPVGPSYEQIAEQFDSKGLFEKRIFRLVQNGQVRREKGRYYSVDSAFLKIARLNVFVKKVLVGKTSEFDE